MLIRVLFWQIDKIILGFVKQPLTHKTFEADPIIRSQQYINVRIHGEVKKQQEIGNLEVDSNGF